MVNVLGSDPAWNQRRWKVGGWWKVESNKRGIMGRWNSGVGWNGKYDANVEEAKSWAPSSNRCHQQSALGSGMILNGLYWRIQINICARMGKVSVIVEFKFLSLDQCSKPLDNSSAAWPLCLYFSINSIRLEKWLLNAHSSESHLSWAVSKVPNGSDWTGYLPIANLVFVVYL